MVFSGTGIIPLLYEIEGIEQTACFTRVGVSVDPVGVSFSISYMDQHDFTVRTLNMMAKDELDCDMWSFHINETLRGIPYAKRMKAGYSFMTDPRAFAIAPALSRSVVLALKNYDGSNPYRKAVALVVANDVLPAAVREQLRLQFRQVDRNGTGFVHREEFIQVC